MQDGILHTTNSSLVSSLSFRPLVAALKKNIDEGNPGMQKLYGQVVRDLEQHPELMGTINDLAVLLPHAELIQELLSAVFPPTTANYMYGVAYPFRLLAVYASPLFKIHLIKPDSNEIHFPENQAGASLAKQRLDFAYGLILKKYLGFNSPESSRLVYSMQDEQTGLTHYMEMRLDGRFIDVKPIGEMPELPKSAVDPLTNRLLTVEELIEKIPIDKFSFEGVTVMRVNDITEVEVISRMKDRLLDNNVFLDAAVYKELEKYIQSLIGLKNLSIGITPFFKINGHYIYSDLHNTNSILFRSFQSSAQKDDVSDYCKLLFRDNNQPLLFETLNDEVLNDVQCLPYYYQEGARSLILYPLKLNNDLIGMLEVISAIPSQLKAVHVRKIEAAIPLFSLGLQKSLELLINQVDKLIKRKFTAVQPAVEWKFTDAALNFIVNHQQKDDLKIERITFNDVYPLYGAIDIRNSSTERARAIQLDIIEQLQSAKQIVEKAKAVLSHNFLQETEFKIAKYLNAAKDILKAEEELSIQEFLQTQVTPLFKHLQDTAPTLKIDIEGYFSSINPQLGMVYNHRREYEESISQINDSLARFVDKEQASAQKVYPHYFERYVTDGLEFNIHMGQSITPRKKFDEIYLRNMKMWQLTIIAKAAKMTHSLEKELSHPLRTTQLILSHSQPLSITFRIEERKFDVDGAYNTRYEIIKKRIDKVKIRETNERLTQPGKIAIVYSQLKDAEEYMEYIEYLQHKNLLMPGIEKHDLEELQGVIGLKALRVDVNFDAELKAETKAEILNTTAQ